MGWPPANLEVSSRQGYEPEPSSERERTYLLEMAGDNLPSTRGQLGTFGVRTAKKVHEEQKWLR